MSINLKDNDLVFAKVKPNAIIPSKEDENAGYDIYACFEEDYMVIPRHSTKLIPTGIASAMTEEYYLQVHERGSTGTKGMKYGAGVVDSSYRGEIFVCINNVNSYDIIISKLSQDDLINKYTIDDGHYIQFVNPDYKPKEGYTYYDYDGNEIDYDPDEAFYLYYIDEFEDEEVIIYPYEKAIAQLIVHEVPKMNVSEITYDELKNIPSKRGMGALGSSGK